MISTKTATDIANKNKCLEDAKYYIENVETCVGVLTVIMNGMPPETVAFGGLQGQDLKNTLEAVIDGLNSDLDELNRKAVEEAEE